MNEKRKENEIVRELEQALSMIAAIFRLALFNPNSMLFDIVNVPFYSQEIEVHEEKRDNDVYIYVWLPNEIDSEEVEVVPVNKKSLVLLSRKIGLLKKIQLRNKIKPETVKVLDKKHVVKIMAKKAGFLL